MQRESGEITISYFVTSKYTSTINQETFGGRNICALNFLANSVSAKNVLTYGNC